MAKKKKVLNRLMTPAENPTGLHQKYVVRELTEFGELDVPNKEFLVLRVDDNVSDKKWAAACRAALEVFVCQLRESHPELASDMMNRHGIRFPHLTITSFVNRLGQKRFRIKKLIGVNGEPINPGEHFASLQGANKSAKRLYPNFVTSLDKGKNKKEK